MPERLDCIAMHKRALGMRKRYDMRDGLHGSNLVVCAHHTNEGHIGAQHVLKRLEIDDAVGKHRNALNRETITLKGSCRVKNRVMLYSTHKHTTALGARRLELGQGSAADSERVGLGAAAREDNLAGTLGTHGARNVGTSAFKRGKGGTTACMQGVWVGAGPFLGVVASHFLTAQAGHGARRRMVEIVAHAHA